METISSETDWKTGRMKNQLYDEITEEKIKSKTSDQRITKSFRLDEIIDGLKAQKPKNRPQMRIRPAPAGKADEIDYAPEVDPYEDMDVEGLLDLQDYVAPQAEKQIAKMPEGPPPKYEMDPSLSFIPIPPPPPRHHFSNGPSLNQVYNKLDSLWMIPTNNTKLHPYLWIGKIFFGKKT